MLKILKNLFPDQPPCCCQLTVLQMAFALCAGKHGLFAHFKQFSLLVFLMTNSLYLLSRFVHIFNKYFWISFPMMCICEAILLLKPIHIRVWKKLIKKGDIKLFVCLSTSVFAMSQKYIITTGLLALCHHQLVSVEYLGSLSSQPGQYPVVSREEDIKTMTRCWGASKGELIQSPSMPLHIILPPYSGNTRLIFRRPWANFHLLAGKFWGINMRWYVWQIWGLNRGRLFLQAKRRYWR